MENDYIIKLCKGYLDFDAPMITCLSEDLEISKEQAEKIIGDNLEAIYND